MHFGGVLGTSAWAGVCVTQAIFYTNVHICEHTRCRLCTYVYMYSLFSNLRKPSNVVEAPAIANNVAVDARNLALLFSVTKYPPPGYDLMPNSRDDFSRFPPKNGVTPKLPSEVSQCL